MSIEQRLAQSGVELSTPGNPKGSYVPALILSDIVYVSGTLPILGDSMLATGIVGREVNLAQAQASARQCIVNILSRLKADLGSLDRIEQWVKLTGFVASTPDFTEQPKVMNAASDLVKEIFGDAGSHARSAIGVAALPLGAPVEVEAIVKLGS